MSTTCGCSLRCSAPPPSTHHVTPSRPWSRTCSGSDTSQVISPRPASRSRSPSGRSSTAIAPSRLRAATTVNALGRVLISTPTRSSARTPTLSRPLTTLSTRCLTSRWRYARSPNRKQISSGTLRACSSSSSPSEIRVAGSSCSMRASRGSWAGASDTTPRAARTACRAVPSRIRVAPIPISVAWARAEAAALGRRVVGLDAAGRHDVVGQLGEVGAPARPGRDRGPGDVGGLGTHDQAEVPARQGQLVHLRLRARPCGWPAPRRGGRWCRWCRARS